MSSNKNNQKKKVTALELAKDAIAVDMKNRSESAVKEFEQCVKVIEGKYNVRRVVGGKFSAGRIETFTSFVANPISINK